MIRFVTQAAAALVAISAWCLALDRAAAQSDYPRLSVAIILLIIAAMPKIRRRRDEVFVE